MNKELIAKELLKMAKEVLIGNTEDKVFDVNSVEEWTNKLKSSINAPYVNVYNSTLGGEKRISILLRISIEPKENWLNGILQNSRYFMMHLFNDGDLELFSGGTRFRKFRKTNVKSVEEAIKKINKYIDEVKVIEKWW